MMSNSKPVYDFLGYKLLKVMFNRYNDEKLEKFSFIVTDQHFNNNVFSFCVNTKLFFKDNDESNFIFLSAFYINDLDWYNELDNNMRDSMFFSIVFPFIRQKINEFCDDSRETIKLPIINLKHTRLDKEVIFEIK
jgi:hypothetical protein